jgi:alpha-glucosidase
MTQFNFTENLEAWWIPGDFDSYEYLYSERHLGEIETANTPVTFRSASGYCYSIHEGNLTDYAAMTLIQNPKIEYGLVSRLVPWADGILVKGITPLVSPWRTIQISPDAAGLVRSNLIANVNPPCRIKETDWIDPMKYLGVWWGMHIGYQTWTPGPRHGATTENAKRYIDFSAENGFDAVLFEGWNQGWDRWGQPRAFDMVTPARDFNLIEIAAYAKEKGVDLIGHHETGGDVLYYEQQMDTAFKLLSSLGIRAVKTGYAGMIRPEGEHHQGQYMVRHYRNVVEKAAQYGIMVNVHEPVKFTGESRTYPNLMTGEGVRGMEWNAWSTGNPPSHTAIIPFTRMLAGPVDYTPGIFDLRYEKHQGELFDWNSAPREGVRVHTTLARQLALMVVLYSPMQMASDLPENYEGHPAFEFIRQLPASWVRTEVLTAEIGDHITIARQHGDTWFIGSITDEMPRDLVFALDFLDAGRSWRMTIYADTDSTHYETNPSFYFISEKSVSPAERWKARLAAGGGQAIILRPE